MPSSSPRTPAPAITPSLTLPGPAMGIHQHTAQPGVIQDRHSGVADAEVEAHIRDLGKLAEKAMADGDPTGARIWTDRMYAAIAARSPEHRTRAEAEALRRAEESTFAGEWALRLAQEVAK